MAASLVVNPAPAPAGDSATAVTSIRSAFQQAYSDEESPTTKLDAIQGGAELAPVLAQITRQLPDTVHTTKITAGAVTFVDPSHALVDYTLTFQYQGNPVTMNGPGMAVLVNGIWKVSQSSYCNSIQQPGVTLTCPPK